ncbi:18541_t:CDS:1, partial [Acaulospora morrowiae]
GQIIGCEKGFELSQEIGFYDGVAELWLKILEKGWNIAAKKTRNDRWVNLFFDSKFAILY